MPKVVRSPTWLIKALVNQPILGCTQSRDITNGILPDKHFKELPQTVEFTKYKIQGSDENLRLKKYQKSTNQPTNQKPSTTTTKHFFPSLFSFSLIKLNKTNNLNVQLHYFRKKKIQFCKLSSQKYCKNQNKLRPGITACF